MGTINPLTGETQYYLGIVPGSWRTFATEYDSFGAAPEQARKSIRNSTTASTSTGDAIYVNFFIPSEVNWAGKRIRLRQETKFPEESSTRLEMTLNQPATFALNLRISVWVASSPVITINGQQINASGTPSSYLSIHRTWKPGDVLEMSLPMNLRVEEMPDDPSLIALCYGPLVLAGDLQGEGPGPVLGHMGPDLKHFPSPTIPTLRIAADAPEKLIRSDSQRLSFKVPAQTGVIRFAPFYKLQTSDIPSTGGLLDGSRLSPNAHLRGRLLFCEAPACSPAARRFRSASRRHAFLHPTFSE